MSNRCSSASSLSVVGTAMAAGSPGAGRARVGSAGAGTAGSGGADAVTPGVGSAAVTTLSAAAMSAADSESSRALNALSTPLLGGPSVQRDTVIAVTRIVSAHDAIAGAATGGALSA